jgi:hypothetical protein
MTPELQDQLFKKYPKIFGQRDLPMTHTAMCWGVECNDGWYKIIDILCSSIQWHLDHNNRDGKIYQVEATQVKEKYGELCFYHIGGDDFIDGLITMATQMSLNVCEETGEWGELCVRGGWYKTLSPVKALELEYKTVRELGDHAYD